MSPLPRRRLHVCRVALLAAILAAAVTLVPPTVTAHARTARAGSLTPLLLTASDIKSAYGSGFKLIMSRQTSNSELRSTSGSASATTLQGLDGRVTGYITMYTRQAVTIKGKKTTVKPGVTFVLEGLNQYRNSDYAHRIIAAALKTRLKLPKGTAEKITPLAGVGDMAIIASVHTSGVATPSTSSIYVGFQRGRYTAIVDVVAYGGMPRSDTVLGLARLLDGRIRLKG